MCRNWKLWGVLGALALAVLVAAADARTSVLPLLFVAACPLSMVLMAVSMGRGTRTRAGRDARTDEQLPAR